MTEILAWLWFPAVFYALSLGAGLLAERLAGIDLPNALLPPVGLGVMLLAITPGYRLGAGAAVGVAVVVVVALAGFVLAGRPVRSRLAPGWMAVAAGVGAYLLYLAPVALSGHWTWAGYEFVNDTSANLVFADHVGAHGETLIDDLNSTTDVVAATPVELNYPLGAHFLLATVHPLSGAPMAAIYAPFMAVAGGFAAISFASVARRVGMPAAAAALAGLLAAIPNLLYRYVLHGALKEVLVVALLATAAAVGGELLARRAGLRPLLVLVVVVLPLLGVFSAVGALYGAVLAVPLIAVVLWRARPSPKRLAAAAVLVLAVALVAVGPTIVDTVRFGLSARSDFAQDGGASTAFLGQLVRPLPLGQAAGIWFGRDYRYPQVGDAVLPSHLLIGMVAVLFVMGVVYAVRRRELSPLALLLAAGGVAAVLSPLLSPYADAKLLVVLSPVVVLFAAFGVYWLGQGGRVRMAVAGLVAFVAAGATLGSAAVAYRSVQLAPTPRMVAMEDAAQHAGGGGRWLVNEWEEFGRYFMRDIDANMAFEAESPEPARLRRSGPLFGQFYDLDEETLAYVSGFPGIIMRRSPTASRPPANFEKAYENRYYEVWRRRAGIKVARHLPLQTFFGAGATPKCAEVKRIAAAGAPGERLVAARRPPITLFDTARNRIRGWVLNQAPQPVRTVTPVIPGKVGGRVRTGGGRFRVWIRGSFGRAVSVTVDGKRMDPADQVNSPKQWLPLGTTSLAPGSHRIEITRPETSLAPGQGYRGYIGPVVLEPVAPRPLVSVRLGDAGRLCGKRWDWIERVSGAAK